MAVEPPTSPGPLEPTVQSVDRAFALLELLFTMPAGRDVTVPFVRAWPAFDPLRGDPRLERLLARFGPQQ